jgi:hypothetical protein
MKKPALGSSPADGKAIHMVYEKELLDRIEDYRFRNRYPTRVEAIKALLNTALDLEKKNKTAGGRAT